MMIKKNNSIQKETKTVNLMIELYCKKNHHSKLLCNDCKQLLKYSIERLNNCVHKMNKPPCSKCKIHCFKPLMRDKIRRVMQFSGPRIIYYYPLFAFQHFLQNKQNKQ